ncbi:autotransporter domain-containing protein [Pyruvatibacter sp. HU-CL02332]|uniref:autotransporter domain-containing protein n=1 Tax=Pyruvatibacter sp. HU-CL02332 TaxID=3127650 RepID=UPI00310500B8
MKKRLGAALSGACGMGIAALFGAAMMTASTTPAAAQSATSCNGGNVSGFNRTAPAGGAANVNQSGTFFVGDVITATATGIILSVAFDVNPGNNLLLFLNNTTGSGSFTFPSSGTFTINGAVNAAGGGSATVSFTCVSGPGANASGSNGTTSQDTEETLDNTDAINQAIEEEAARDLIEDGSELDPDLPSGGTLTEEEEWRIKKRIEKITERQKELDNEIKAADESLKGLQQARETARDATEDTSNRSAAEIMAEIFVDARQARNEGAYQRRLQQISDWELQAQSERLDAMNELQELYEEVQSLEAKLREHNGQPPLMPFSSATTASADRFERDFQDIVRHFDEATEAPYVQELSFDRTLTNKTVAWVRASFTRYKQGDATQQKGDTVVAAVGVHHDFWEDIRLGTFVTTKWSDVKAPLNNLDIDTRGYSLGVFGRYKIDGLALKATVRYGISDSDISVANTTGSYDSNLIDLTLGVSGRDDWSNGIWVTHSTSFSSTWSHRDGYTNSVGTRIGDNDLWSGRVSHGPTFGTTIENEGIFTVIEPALGASANYNWTNRDSQSGNVATSDDDYFSLAVTPQLSLTTEGGASLDLYTSVFGIAADVDGWSVGGTFSLPLN